MRIFSLLSFMPLLAYAEFSLPDNAIEGFAIHLEDEAGNVTYVHHSEFDNYGISIALGDTDGNGTETTFETKRSLPQGDSITCERQKTFDISDLHHGTIKLMEYLDCGFTIITSTTSKWKYVAASHYEGSSVIYICNYSGSYRTIKGAQLLDFEEQVFNYCGQQNVAGWYTEHFYDMAWGYTNSKYGFCGPKQ